MHVLAGRDDAEHEDRADLDDTREFDVNASLRPLPTIRGLCSASRLVRRERKLFVCGERALLLFGAGAVAAPMQRQHRVAGRAQHHATATASRYAKSRSLLFLV